MKYTEKMLILCIAMVSAILIIPMFKLHANSDHYYVSSYCVPPENADYAIQTPPMEGAIGIIALLKADSQQDTEFRVEYFGWKPGNWPEEPDWSDWMEKTLTKGTTDYVGPDVDEFEYDEEGQYKFEFNVYVWDGSIADWDLIHQETCSVIIHEEGWTNPQE